MLVYRPGRTTCEPFRKYNTQLNGIYGYVPRTDAVWQSFSNWCPGDVIDNRIISLGAFGGGQHPGRISVPAAQFVGGQGDIPVSMFSQGVTQGQLPSGINWISVPDYQAAPVAANGTISFRTAGCKIYYVTVYDLQGIRKAESVGTTAISTRGWALGIYLVNMQLDNNLIVTKKVLVR